MSALGSIQLRRRAHTRHVLVWSVFTEQVGWFTSVYNCLITNQHFPGKRCRCQQYCSHWSSESEELLSLQSSTAADGESAEELSEVCGVTCTCVAPKHSQACSSCIPFCHRRKIEELRFRVAPVAFNTPHTSGGSPRPRSEQPRVAALTVWKWERQPNNYSTRWCRSN